MDNLERAFSNLTRVKILACLSGNSKNVTGLINNCDISQSAVSQHLKKLKDMGLLECETIGRERVYSLRHEEAGEISRKILNLIKQ